MFRNTEASKTFRSVLMFVSYIMAAVVSELQAEVLLLQQFQMAANFVEEVPT